MIEQQPGVPHLEQQVRNAADTSERVHALNTLAWELLENDTPRALHLATEARELAEADSEELGTALCTIGRAHYMFSEYTSAETATEQALTIFRNRDHAVGQATALLTLAYIAYHRGDMKRTAELCAAALDFARKEFSYSTEAGCHRMIGDVLRVSGDLVGAERSYRESLSTAEQGDDRISQSYALQRLAVSQLDQGEYAEALRILDRALTVAEYGNSLRVRAFSLQTLGMVEISRGQYATALDHYNTALALYRRIGNKTWQAQVLHNIGNIHERLGDYSAALECWKQALTALEAIGNMISVTDSLQGIGSAYLKMNDTKSALENFTRSLQISKEREYAQGEGEALRWIGEAYRQSGNVSEAVGYYEQSVAIHQRLGVPELELESLHTLGDAYNALGDKEHADKYYLQSLRLAEQIGASYHEGFSLIRLGELSPDDTALEYLNRALAIAESTQAKELLFEAHKALSLVYERRGEYQESLKHYKAFHDTKEGVFNEESDQRMKNLAVQYEVEKKEREAEIHRLKNVELAQLNNDLREANRIKNEFLRVAAHDLKNPLSGVMMMTELTLQRLPQDSPARQTQEMVYHSSGRMLEIVNKLLDIAKLESGTIQIVKEQVNIPELVSDIVALNIESAERKEQHIQTHIMEDCIVAGDPGWLRESVDNILSNAIKYSPRGKGIVLEVKSDPQWVYVTVRDEGPGISEEDQSRLFGAFQRLSARPTGGESSTGLGLSIVKQLIELHGGNISVESQLGNGSSFTIALPRN